MVEVTKLFILLMVGLCFCGSYCNILETFKDAVLGAEGMLNNIGKSIDTALKFTKEAWEDSLDEECKFSCPNGNKPKKNKYHTPTSNGCGVPEMKINLDLLPFKDMTKCCDVHDVCYGTCNRDKDECDLAFKKCLYSLCDKKGTTDSFLNACKTAAKALYSGTMMFGCKFYKTAQQEACYCGSSKFRGDEL